MDSPRSDATPEDRSPVAGSVEVTVSSSPKFWPFAGAGAVVGVLAAMFTALAGDPGGEFSQGSVFGFFAIVFGLAGAFLGCLVFLIVDTVLRRRTRRARAVPVDDGDVTR